MKIHIDYKLCLVIEVIKPKPKNWFWACWGRPYPSAKHLILGFNLWTLVVRLWIGNWR